MMSDVRYEIKTPLPVIWLENIWHKNSGLVRTQRTEQLILVDPVDDEDVEELRPRTDPPNFWWCDLNKRKIITHPIVIVYHRSSLYIGIGNWLYSNIFIVITD